MFAALTLIGLSLSKDSELKCQICSSTQTVRQSLELGQFFICIPLRDQLKALLENEPITNIYNDQNRNGITDISDGKLYKYLKSVSDSFFSLLLFFLLLNIDILFHSSI